MNKIVEDEEGFSGEKIGFLEEKTEIWKEKKKIEFLGFGGDGKKWGNEVQGVKKANLGSLTFLRLSELQFKKCKKKY